MNGVSITLENCGKTFPDGTRALDPVNMKINEGETVVFLGPSGCGKTTTLRIIAGLDQPDPGGSVMFDGENVTDLPIERRNVGMVFQSYALFPNMTVAENIGYGLRVRKMPKRESSDRVDEMLNMVRMTELADRNIDQLSGGQRQRVALARAIAVRPRVLLLDEPLTALDAKLRDGLRAEIDALLRRLKITAIYVTHDQAEAMALGDRIVVMTKGRIAQIGKPREIYFTPANREVAEFIGTMNRLKLESGEIFFRPSDVDVVPQGAGTVDGQISSVFFLGDRTRILVQASGHTDVPLVVDQSERATFNPGQTIGLRVDPERTLRLQES